MFTFPVGHMGASGPSLEYLGQYDSASSLTTYSFTNKNIGSASSDRLVVVCVGGFRDIGGEVSSATIGGVSATIHTTASVTNNSHGIFSANVTSGSTATVSVTWSVTQAGCSIAIYVIKGLSSFTPDFALEDDAVPLSQSISPAAGSVVIATATKYDPSASWTWGGTAGLSEDMDITYGTDIKQSCASKIFSAAETSKTVTATTAPASVSGMHIVGFS